MPGVCLLIDPVEPGTGKGSQGYMSDNDEICRDKCPNMICFTVIQLLVVTLVDKY